MLQDRVCACWQGTVTLKFAIGLRQPQRAPCRWFGSHPRTTIRPARLAYIPTYWSILLVPCPAQVS